MSADILLGTALALGLLIYFGIALIRPEKF